jgi:hypothetical protein
MRLRLRVRTARGSSVVICVVAAAAMAIIAMACAGSAAAAEPPGQFVPDAPLPDGLREIKVLEPKPKTGPGSTRSPSEPPAEEMTDIWQPKHAGEIVERAKAAPGQHFQRGSVKPPANNSRAQ